MNDLTILLFITFIIPILIAIGHAIDYLLLKREKPKIYHSLFNLGRQIYFTEFPKIHSFIIEKALAIFDKILPFKKNFLKTSIHFFIVSWVITSIISVLVIYLDIDPLNPSNACENFHDYLPWYPTYIVNIVFDFFTFFVTYKVLNWVKDKSLLRGLIGILSDILLAFFLAAICFSTDRIINEYLLNNSSFATQYLIDSDVSEFNNQNNSQDIALGDYLNKHGHLCDSELDCFKQKKYKNSQNFKIYQSNIPVRFFTHAFQFCNQALHIFNLKKFNDHEFLYPIKYRVVVTESNLSDIFYIRINGISSIWLTALALTSFIPTLILLSLILFILISKEIFHLTKLLSLRVLEATLEKVDIDEKDFSGFKPGAHFGAVLGVFLALTKLIHEILKYVAS